MASLPNDVFTAEKPVENHSINSVFRQSYNYTKKQLQDGISAMKEELQELYDKTGDYLHKIVLPVNNFLKDLTQIDAELRQELNKDLVHLTPAQPAGCGTIIPIEQALSGMMEENY